MSSLFVLLVSLKKKEFSENGELQDVEEEPADEEESFDDADLEDTDDADV